MALIEEWYLLLYYSKKGEIFHRKISIRFSVFIITAETLKMSLPWNQILKIADQKKQNDTLIKGQDMDLQKSIVSSILLAITARMTKL